MSNEKSASTLDRVLNGMDGIARTRWGFPAKYSIEVLDDYSRFVPLSIELTSEMP